MAFRRPRKSLKPKRPTSVRSGPNRGKRHTFHLSLTADEVQQLREAAAAEVRSISNYVVHLVAKDLARDLRKERLSRRASPPLGRPDDKRTSYSVSVELPSQEHRKLYCRARDERRRMSSYVTKVVLEGLRSS